MALYLQKIVCPLLIKWMFIAFCLFQMAGCQWVNGKEERLPYYDSADLTPQWDHHHSHHIAPFNLVDQTGQAFGSDSLNGKIYIANFFFTTCLSICPKMTKCIKLLQDSIASMQNINIVSFTVMPWVDSVNRLKAYGAENNIHPTYWHLLTGPQSTIYGLGRASFFADNHASDDTSSFLHTDKMYLIDQQQQIRGVYNATNMNDVGRVLRDIRVLEAMLKNKVGLLSGIQSLKMFRIPFWEHL